MSSSTVTSVTVRAPGTTANMGPGFDCLGMAVDIYNELTLAYAPSFSMVIEGEGAGSLPRDESNLIVKCVQHAFKVAKKPYPPLAYHCRNGIPFGSGLGSSSAAIVSGLVAGFVLAGHELGMNGKEELLQIAAEFEGHIDNLSPCIYGGMQIGFHNGQRWQTAQVPVPASLRCIVFTPDVPMSTELARAMLPKSLSVSDAVFNISRVALLIHGFCTGDLSALSYATEDKIHQPTRGSKEVMPALFPVIQAALKNGANASFLSGAGSSIMALVLAAKGCPDVLSHEEQVEKRVGGAMKVAAEHEGVRGTLRYASPSIAGVHVVKKETTQSSFLYRSTRMVKEGLYSFEHVVMEGLAPDGGLYVPSQIPSLCTDQMKQWEKLSFPDLAFHIMSLYISPDEIPRDALRELLVRSYSTFSHPDVTPLVKMSEDGSIHLLEQFHGPSCAFKDVALQFLGNLFEFFLKRTTNPDKKKITVLGATSGDTGGAAIYGLRGKENIEVIILHPQGRVAAIQEAQMTSVLDANIHNVAVEGSFDDCQTIVKTLFSRPELRNYAHLAAINSINWARILAQIVYYFFAYYRWLEADPNRQFGDKVNIVVPTGNFGNCLAGFYARSMGIPIGRLIVATNENDILHRFFANNDYSAKPVVPTLAPAMDIVIPSNFERYLFHLLDNDPVLLNDYMRRIKETNSFVLSEPYFSKVKETFLSARANDEEIRAVIADYQLKRKYSLCPHTATTIHAINVLRGNGSLPQDAQLIALATAHPAKFGDKLPSDNNYPPIPPQLQGLLEKEQRCVKTKNNPEEVQEIVKVVAKRHYSN